MIYCAINLIYDARQGGKTLHRQARPTHRCLRGTGTCGRAGAPHGAWRRQARPTHRCLRGTGTRGRASAPHGAHVAPTRNPRSTDVTVSGRPQQRGEGSLANRLGSGSARSGGDCSVQQHARHVTEGKRKRILVLIKRG